MSVSHALSGIWRAFQSERHMRIHALVAIVVLALAFALRLSALEWVVLLLTIGIVVSLELVNSAIERTVDLVTDEYRSLAKEAKDMAAGAVLVAACSSVVIGIVIFLPHLYVFFKN